MMNKDFFVNIVIVIKENANPYHTSGQITVVIIIMGLGFWCLTPLLTEFQLYRYGQFYWWRKLEYRKKPLTVASH